MKTLFEIGSEDHAAKTLLLEIGQDYCCYAFLDLQSKIFYCIKYISLNELEAEEKLTTILSGVKSEYCEKIIVCFAFSEALLVPHKYNHQGNALLDVIYDKPLQKHLTDYIQEWQMSIAYFVPLKSYSLLSEWLPSVQFFHAYTPTLKIYNGFVNDHINIHFTVQYFRVLVKKEQQVLLMQTYFYKTPLDVVYYLLKICSELKLSQSEIFLIISGLVDQDSAMYAELHNYFLNLHFAQAPAYTLPENDYPYYYFTSLYNLAACVS